MKNIQDNDNVVTPDVGHDYHGHPNYLRVFIFLLILFAISLVAGFFVSPIAAVAIIFVVAVWKSALVVSNFMHLKYEPLIIWIAVAAVLFCLLAFFWGIYPDITAVKLDVAPR